MSDVGKRERETQDRLISLFRDELQYRYLGDWSDREGNTNVEGEILGAWLLKVVNSKYEPAYPVLEKFLLTVGRRKYIQPLYAAMAKTPAGAEMALRIYERARPGYHSVSQSAIDQVLGWRG